MQGYFARVESFLERAEAALSKLSLLPAMLKTSTMSGPPVEVGASSSTEDKVAEIYVFSLLVLGTTRLPRPPCLLFYLPLRARPSPRS
jgi:hypothetical protein